MFNFNRGFAALGIPSAISNLWSVDSKSTYQLTEFFYKFLADRYQTDIALQKAKLELIKINGEALPFHWAASILTGKADSITLRKTLDWMWLAPTVCIFFLVSFIWIRPIGSRRRRGQVK